VLAGFLVAWPHQGGWMAGMPDFCGSPLIPTTPIPSRPRVRRAPNIDGVVAANTYNTCD
jgi:hypothetical protein